MRSHNTGEALATVAAPSFQHHYHSDSAQHRPSHPQVRPTSLQLRPSTDASSSSLSSAPGTGQQQTSARDSTSDAQPSGSSAHPIDYDSDDSQVKKKTKVTALEWQGETLRNTFSVRTLMEDGQLQLLVHHVGDFVNNYTAEVFKMGIIRRHSKSALMAGMNLTMNANHDLDRFQSLACFAIKELQDNLYFQKYSFPEAQTTFSLFAEHLSDQISCRRVWLRDNFV